MLYVGRPAFAARLSVFDVPITVSLHTKRLRYIGLMSVSLSTDISHLFTLHSYLTEKKTPRTHLKLTQFIFWKTNTTRPTTKQILTVAIAVLVSAFIGNAL